MRSLALCTSLFAFSLIAEAQSVINLVTDAASYAPRVAPGALASIFGSNLANGTQSATTFPLPTTMAGATVYVNSTQVPLLYVSETQINFQVPSSTTAGTASVYVSRDGGTSATYNFAVIPSAPGIFQSTTNHAVAQNLTNYSTNSDSDRVASGDILVVYLSGIGAVNNSVTDGSGAPSSPIATATAAATATIGGMSATVDFLGLTPGFAGLAQANIVVPSLATGDYPLVLNVGGYLSSSALVSVSGSGSAPPTYLTPLGQVGYIGGLTNSVQIYGNITYVCGTNNIVILDTSDVDDPIYDSEFGDTYLAGNGGNCVLNTSTSEPILVDIVGPGSAPTFAVFNVEDPTDPVLIAQTSTGTGDYTYLTNLSFVGTTGFASTSWYTTSGTSITAQYGNFLAYDFSSLFPELISVLSSGSGSGGLNLMPNALALPSSSSYPNTAYITSTTATGTSTSGLAALDVVNISSPSSMTGIEQVTVPNAAIFTGFGYDLDLLLVTGNTAGYTNPANPYFSSNGYLTLSTMNIGNVDAPVGIANLTTKIPTTGTYVVQPLGSDIFAIINNPPASDPTGPSSLWIVDATNSSSPVLHPFGTQFGMSDLAAVVVTDTVGYLLAPNTNGLTIYSFQP